MDKWIYKPRISLNSFEESFPRYVSIEEHGGPSNLIFIGKASDTEENCAALSAGVEF